MLYDNFSPCCPVLSLIFFIFMIYHLLRFAIRLHLFCAPFPPPTFATSPPHLASPGQPGRAPTWCTITCWPMWTGPSWTRRAAVAACRGQNCLLTSRRTLTMTPSGPPTVTGWVQCRVRAASLTRTKELTVLPHCTVMSRTARLPLIFNVLEETRFFLIYLFIFWYISCFFANLFVIFIFELLVLRCLKHLPVALPLSLLCASSLCVVVMQ